MAKIVSSKFGDRRLVYLPPINFEASKTPNVETIAPARHGRRRDDGAIIPKEYAYSNQVSQQPELPIGGYFAGVPKRPEGNLVLDKPSPRRNVLSEHIFEQLIQQANADTLTGYSQGKYPVLPGQSDSQQYKQYTNYGLQGLPPQKLPAQQQSMSSQPVSAQQQHMPPQQQQMLPQQQLMSHQQQLMSQQQQLMSQQQQLMPPQQQPMPPHQQLMPPPQMQPPQVQPGMPQAYNAPMGPTGGHNPNEKHIYHGPDGQIIPGPPTNNAPMGPTGGQNPNEKHIYYGPDGQIIPGPPTNNAPMGPTGGQNPNEKHIYYGPDGQVIPGPPNQQSDNRESTQDFAIEGLLRHGRLTAVNLFESDRGFPIMPEYLVKDLQMKYGQFELTLVRIVARGGQCYVHATPQIPMMQEPPPPPPPPPQAPVQAPVQEIETKDEYVPVYLEEDEEFDYDKFMDDYKEGKYQAGAPKSFRSLPPPEQRQVPEYRAAPIEIRPHQSEYRYRATSIEIKSHKPVLPYRDPVTADQPRRPITEDYHWQYSRDRQRNSITRAWDTRRDIRPVENLGNPSIRYTQ